MNGGQHRGPFDFDGCFTMIGWLFLIGVCLMGFIGILQYFFNKPDLVCKAYKTVDEIEEVTNGYRVEKIVVPKKYCTEWGKP